MWTAPVDNGGSSVTGYIVTPYIGTTAQTPQPFNDTLTTHNITNLNNGQTYTFKVAAINDVGTGAESGASNAVTPVNTPPVQVVAGISRQATSNSTISATVPPPGVVSGDTVVVSVATGTFAGTAGCTDSRGNSYSVIADKNTGNGRLFVCRAIVASGKALVSGDTVSASYPGFSGLSVISVNQIHASSSTAAVSTNSGSNSSVSSGNITVGGPSLLIGVVANTNVATFTPGSGWNAVGAQSAGSGAAKRTVTPMWRTVSSGTFAATGALSGAGFWQATINGFPSS